MEIGWESFHDLLGCPEAAQSRPGEELGAGQRKASRPEEGEGVELHSIVPLLPGGMIALITPISGHPGPV